MVNLRLVREDRGIVVFLIGVDPILLGGIGVHPILLGDPRFRLSIFFCFLLFIIRDQSRSKWNT